MHLSGWERSKNNGMSGERWSCGANEQILHRILIEDSSPASYKVSLGSGPAANTLGQGVSIKDGVSVPRSTVGAVKSDDTAAPISSSPALVPAVKSADGVKSFGSVAVQNGLSHSATKSAFLNRPPTLSQASTSPANQAPPSTPSPHPKIDIAKLFQGPSVTSTHAPPSEPSSSPAVRNTSLPQQSHPPPGAGQPYTPTFTPSGNLRAQSGQNGNQNGGAPRSPVFPRPLSNGTSGGVGVSGRPQGGNGPSNGPPPAAMPSPRLAPHPHPGPPTGMPQTPMWQPQYYYSYVPGMPPDQQQYMYQQQQWMQHQLPPQHQPPPQHHPQGPPSAGMPMSPRNPPPPLQQVPSTPTQAHAIPPPLHAPHGPPSVTSPPPTPSSTNGARLNTEARAFVPKKVSISIKSTDGRELDLDALKRAPASTTPAAATPPPAPASPSGFKKDSKRTSVRIESQEQKEKRLAGEQEQERLRKEKEEKERKAKEEKERKAKEAKEAEEKAAREKKEAEERKERERKEAEERAKKEAEEAEERKRKEEEERQLKEQQEKARLEEDERVRKAEEQRKEEEAKAAAAAAATAAEAKAKAEAEAAAAAVAAATAAAVAAAAVKPSPSPIPETIKEDGEIEEQEDADAQTAKESENAPPTSQAAPPKAVDKEPLRIDTALSAEPTRRRPGPLNLSTTLNANIAAPLPSALATARIIEDINRVNYPSGIKSPRIELNVNAPAGKFKYDRDFLLQFMAVCKEKPDNLPPLDAIGLEPSEQSSYNMSRGGSGRRNASGSVSTPTGSRSASIGLGFIPGSLGKAGTGNGNIFSMGQFSTSVSKLSSEERFMMSSAGSSAGSGRSASVSGGLGGSQLGGRPSPMVRTPSQGGPGTGKERDRTRSKRGEKRPVSTAYPSQQQHNNSSMGPPLDPVAPLEASANRWMLTERIMHECIKKLLGNVENPEEEEIESLCKLLITVGVLLDTPKAHAHMDVYFSRMKELTKSKNVNSRMQYMLQDVIELRSRKWIPRKAVAAPSTIAQIHEAAAKEAANKEKATQEKGAYDRQMSMSRGGSRRGGERGDTQRPRWMVCRWFRTPPPPTKAGDLSNFGNFSKSPAAMPFGLTSVFAAGKKETKGRENSISRTASSSNMFSMLSQNPEAVAEATSTKPSRPLSRKPSVDPGQSGVPEAPLQRRKLQLLPRSRPVEESKADETPAGSEAGSEAGDDDAAPDAPTMSADEANNKIAEDIKEFFGIRSLDEGESYFSSLPAEHRHRLVDKLLNTVVEMKDADVQLVADLFAAARGKDLVSGDELEEGFNGLAEIIDDVSVDVPKAWTFFVTLLKGAGLDADDARRGRIAEKTMNADKLLGLLT
ncbi:hypothetical protein FA95DRAFT_1575660 [Auriscalpium vulgare]|uniref:Uncharacterized protein n=1 Tax=Auriscalpium vulgare TaxID=40419 RepID=A0ACB8REW7_9AGAM|nr:hypothetical protein FA95DRAFT_1575660 [Auriscalpium vulgare]